MPSYTQYQADSFTTKLFRGNPAAVVLLPYWLEETQMQHIAAENNLSETAFLVKHENHWNIRWFTPVTEVDLCGHATLAAAHILHTEQLDTNPLIRFFSARSGWLPVAAKNGYYTLDFPADVLVPLAGSAFVSALINKPVVTAFSGKTDLLVVLKNEEAVRDVEVKNEILKTLPYRGLIVTAPGREAEVVSRFFAPACGVEEDPVTGSAHTSLAVYWAPVLGKSNFSAIQLSARRGEISVALLEGERVLLGGRAVTFMKGEIYIS